MRGQGIVLIKVVDLFAGPGGLAEGFSRVSGHTRRPTFEVCVSAEKDVHAHATLRLRALYRNFRRGGHVPESYYAYLRGERPDPFDAKHTELWRRACDEAQNLTLGTESGNRLLHDQLKRKLGSDSPWVLIGGPPCQAYSMVGRSRNRGNADYRAADDARHFLYREYLTLLAAKSSPAVFVMENVKGILSARVDGARIFPQILRDLSAPGKALGGLNNHTYRIFSLTNPNTFFEHNCEAGSVSEKDFVVRAEQHGVPQNRHRVILLGVRTDLGRKPTPLKEQLFCETVGNVIAGLPTLFGSVSKRLGHDEPSSLNDALAERMRAGLAHQVEPRVLQRMLDSARRYALAQLNQPATQFIATNSEPFGPTISSELRHWLEAPRLKGVINHQSRSHMAQDLVRYLFCASFAAVHGRSPVAQEFPLALEPAHKNWRSGAFADRFKVQRSKSPSSTITSHISKDGHHFIHPSPFQVRSLTVREAARLQTFPDDYMFLGPRTAQYTQVGNAVPPLLALAIGKVVANLL